MNTLVFRLVPSALLILESFGTAVHLARLLPTLVVYGPVALMLMAARALVAALQFTSGWMLWDDRPPARPIAMFSLAASALLAIPEIGLRLAPTNIDPTFKWWTVIVYAIYAAVMIVSIRPRADESRS